MSKLIKFRTYIHSTKDFSYSGGGGDLQQFIGILDKNSKPIYEKDVVKGIYGLEGIKVIGEVSYSNDKCAYVVDWDYEISNFELDSLEIVGNIDQDFAYNEQGELTEKKKTITAMPKHNSSGYPFYSKKPEVAATELLDGAYDIIELWRAETPSQIAWKKRWMEKAKEIGANPSW